MQASLRHEGGRRFQGYYTVGQVCRTRDAIGEPVLRDDARGQRSETGSSVHGQDTTGARLRGEHGQDTRATADVQHAVGRETPARPGYAQSVETKQNHYIVGVSHRQ